MIYGIDVSYAQGDISWPRVAKSDRVRFAYARACYGSDPAYDDGPVFIANHDGAKAADIPFGAYIFFLLGQDPVAQAKHFLAVIDGYEGTLRPMVDLEEDSGSTGSASGNIAALASFNTHVKQKSGVDPIIYTNADTWDTMFGGTDAFSGHSLWVASFDLPAGQPVMPQGWSTWTIHQYSNKGSVQGISGDVDLDVYNGDNLASITRRFIRS